MTVNKQARSNISPQRRLARGIIILFVLLLIVAYELYGFIRMGEFSRDLWAALDDILLIVLGAGVVYGADRILQLSEEKEAYQKQLQGSEAQYALTLRHQKEFIRASQRYVEAADENEVIQITIELSLGLIGARGVSFVPLDEHAQPMAMHTEGDIPGSVSQAWLEYLATPAVRHQCGMCKKREHFTLDCPLLEDPTWSDLGIFCLPLRRNEQEYGILNLYFQQRSEIEPERLALARFMLDGATMALEGLRLRRQVLTTIRHLQVMRENSDIESLLADLLNSLHETLEADLALVSIGGAQSEYPAREVTSGVIPADIRHLINGIVSSVQNSGQPVMLENVAGDALTPVSVRAMMAAPLIGQDQRGLGVILVGNRRQRAFSQRQIALLQTIASQVALVVQNQYLLAQLEYKTMIDERTRLAREIHDGLAQTLGFLKLKTAQLISSLENGRTEQALEIAHTSHEVLAEAYLDARQSIDGLRLTSNNLEFPGWLYQLAEEFKEYIGINVEVFSEVDNAPLLSTEIQAQLIRIVQEALSNVRKHASASKVEITCRYGSGDYVMEISDDGAGFSPLDIPGSSQHGMRGMRERADLIGAEFQVVSQPQRGTTVRVCLPVSEREMK